MNEMFRKLNKIEINRQINSDIFINNMVLLVHLYDHRSVYCSSIRTHSIVKGL